MKIDGKHLTVDERIAWERRRDERKQRLVELGDIVKGVVVAFAIIYWGARVTIAIFAGRFSL